MVRRAYGVAGAAMQNHSRYNFRVAWPSGDRGSLPIERGLDAACQRELENAEVIIDPRETRALLCDWVLIAYEVESTCLGPKTRGARC